jgi:dihydropteridine reductase
VVPGLSLASLEHQVSLSDGWVEQEAAVCQGADAALRGAKAVAVINMAGGWAGGCSADTDWLKNADLMWKQSVWSSGIAASLAASHLADGGLLVLPGAQVGLFECS